MSDRAELDRTLAEIWRSHWPDMVARLDAIDGAAASLLGEAPDQSAIDRGRAAAHKLAGALGTYGLVRGSALASELEGLLKSGDPSALRVAEIAGQLRAEVVAGPPLDRGGARTLDIAFVAADAAGARALVAASEARGLTAEDIGDVTSLEERLASPERPRLVVVDTDVDRWQDLLAGLAVRRPSVPTAVLTQESALPDRVMVARLGARLALPRTLSPAAIADALRELLAEIDATSPRVLAVDDDPMTLYMLQSILGKQGMNVFAAADAIRLWELLEDVRPDALLVDVDMPGIDGISLCRAIRADRRWTRLPVIFLSARRDTETVQEAFSAGADDYVTKDTGPEELASRIRTRLLRLGARHEVAPAAERRAAEAEETLDVVIVDDDEALTDLVRHALETRGFSVGVLSDGRAAVEALGANGHLRARILLLDVDLPGLDGFSVLRRLAADPTGQRPRTIMLTVRASERETLEALELGAVDHVAKPFSIAVLVQRIRVALER